MSSNLQQITRNAGRSNRHGRVLRPTVTSLFRQQTAARLHRSALLVALPAMGLPLPTSLCAALLPPHVLLQDLPALEGLRGEPQPTLPLMVTSAACHVTALQQGFATWPNSPPLSNPARFKDMQRIAICGNPSLTAPPPPPRSSWPPSCRSGRGQTRCGCTAAGRQKGRQAGHQAGAAWRGWAGEAPLQVYKLSSPAADAPQQPNQQAVASPQ